MADEASGLIPVELLSRWSGLTAEEIAKAVRGVCKLVDGKYPALPEFSIFNNQEPG